ncbi:MAG: hypothetical protein A3H50_01910 [Candidatus Levybacteria bacterium RIFCSPLOWO2_02_FULL_37_10]|nr:MAG: hypothetical protein A2860_00415 [Candidatus Levybacteria bacterium RIFCSPHIGHO2_01_FULL_37_33]OGH17491.1 MAG: hypothetical protein A3C97_00270 [Candidatus Levybacteria bacterium RIFCSPHIGHO2_02_FULL_37_11]OGH29403.1 MAG: hypothetical protein A3F30_00045 [Candidatus Levybacteria bacterium RIFCSPHIGHO2_12_FULL_37_12]OGH32911.1 MAG: hypothetical protein A2953_02115 [Candidatus Levybacteria bacterium RIFCSPLOWO2_01_FULL_36_54]OGH43293.1 MAG: hypothetical protein A3H50_01910 [Candidatus Lev
MPKEHLSSVQVGKFWKWARENHERVTDVFRDTSDNSGWVVGDTKEPMFIVGGRVDGSEADLYYPTASAEELARAGVIFDSTVDTVQAPAKLQLHMGD